MSRTLHVLITGTDKLSGVLVGTTKALGKTTAAAGAFATALAGISLKQAIDFDRSMRNVDSIAKLSEQEFADLQKQVINLSKTLPQSADTLAQGLYDIQSSGFAGVEAMAILETSAKGASAGLTSTATSADALTSVMNAYNRKTGKDATEIMDVLFATVDRGKLSFEGLAQNVGDVTATAAALNVPIEQVGAGFALLTKNGISVAESGTALNSFMRSLLKPSDEAADLAKKLGIQWDTQAIQAKGLNGVLADMITKTKGNQTQIAALTGDARAIKAAFILAARDGRGFTEELQYMTTAAGATQGALQRQSKGTAFQLQLLKNAVSALGIEIQVAMLPSINRLIARLLEIVEKHGPRVRDTIIGFREQLMKFSSPVLMTAFTMLHARFNLIYGAVQKLIPLVRQFWDDFGDDIVRVTALLNERFYVAYRRIQDVVKTFWDDYGAQVTDGISKGQEFVRLTHNFFAQLWFSLRYEGLKFWMEYGDNITEFWNRVQLLTAGMIRGFTDLWDRVRGPLDELRVKLSELLTPLLELGGHVMALALEGFGVLGVVFFKIANVILPPLIRGMATFVGWLKAAVEFINPLLDKMTELAAKAPDFSPQGWADFKNGLGLLAGDAAMSLGLTPRESTGYQPRITPSASVMQPAAARVGAGTVIINNPVVRSTDDITAMRQQFSQALYEETRRAQLGMPA